MESLSDPEKSWVTTTYYDDGPAAFFDIVSDFIVLTYQQSQAGPGFITFDIIQPNGRFAPQDGVDKMNALILSLLDKYPGESPMTNLMLELLHHEVSIAKENALSRLRKK